MRKLYIKLGKAMRNISYKVIFQTIIVTAIVVCMLLIPEITVVLNETLDKLNNDGVKNIISAFTDFNLIITDVVKIDRWWIIYPMIFICILAIILLIIKCVFRDREFIDKVIIGHSSMSKVQFVADTDGDYKVEEINLVNDMKDIEIDYDKIKHAIKEQDKFVEEFKRNINTNYDYGYMGIAHIPLIFRMGNQLGDEVAIALFHKYRTGDTKKFKEFNSDVDFKRIQIEHEDLNVSSNELIVGLSTTFPIKLDELKVLKPDNKNIIIFKSEELGFDVITSKKQVDAYIQFMMDKIRDVVKDKNITKIHMVLSTSVAMTFALGGAISKHHDPKVTIYHFDQNNPRKYTWGIEVLKNYNDCLVVTKEE